MPILDHQPMLRDAIRADAFRRAIAAQIAPGDVVCDLGAGSGLMGLFALQAGAAKVYAIEMGEEIEQAVELAQANGYGECFVAVRGRSTEVELPEKVDWIIVEWLSTLGADEQPLADVADACRRFLKPDGKSIPQTVRHMAVPVEDAYSHHEAVGMFSQKFHGLDFTPLRAYAAAAAHKSRPDPRGYLAEPACWLTVDYLDARTHVPAEAFFGQPLAFAVDKSAQCHGLAAWFEADLGGGVTLSNAPAGPETYWRTHFLPLEPPLDVAAGDRLQVNLGVRATGRQADIVWEVTQRRDGREIARSGSPGLAALSLSRRELARISGRIIPKPGAEDAQLAALLPFCDGRRPAIEVAELAFHNHPKLFADTGDALAALVALWRTRPFDEM